MVKISVKTVDYDGGSYIFTHVCKREDRRDFGTFFSKLRRKFTSLLSKVGEENLK